MWKQKQPTNLLTRLVLTLVLTAQLLDNTLALSDKRLCADINCKEIISMGTGVISYRAGEEGMVSFKINSLIRVKSKSAGSNPSLWGIEVNGREGYAPKEYIRETKILISEKDLKFVVDVKPTKAVPNLSTSEKSEQANTIETTTTQPLNLTPAESTDNPLKHSISENFTAESAPVATPVISEMSDGTKILNFSNSDGIVENINEKVDPLSNLDSKPDTDYEVETDYDIEDIDDYQKEELVSDSKTNNVLSSIEEIKGSAQDYSKVTDDIETKDENQPSTKSIEVPTASNSNTNNVLKTSEEVKDVAQDVQDNLEKAINDGETLESKNSQEKSHYEANNDLKATEEAKGVTQDVQDDLKEEINNEDINSQNKSIVSDSKSNNEEMKGVAQDVNDKSLQMQQDDPKEEIKYESVLKGPVNSVENTDNIRELTKVKENQAEILQKLSILNNSLSEETNIQDVNIKEELNTKNNHVNIGLEENKNRKHLPEVEIKPEESSSENSGQISAEIGESIPTVKGDVSHISNKNDEQVITENSFNSTENSDNNEDISKIAKQYDLSTNNENLDITANEPLINVNLKDEGESNDQTKSENYTQPLKIDERTETDNVNSLPTKTDDLISYKENPITNSINTESFPSSKADKEETFSDNILHNNNSTLNTTPNIPEKELSEKKNHQKDLTETEINSKEISSENLQRASNEIKENDTINKGSLGSDNTNININKLDSAVENTIHNSLDNNNAHISNNPTETQAEQEMGSFPTETTYLPQDKEKMKIESINEYEKVSLSSDSLQPTKVSIVNTTPKTPEGVLSQTTISLENINPSTYSNDADVTLTTPTPQYEDSEKNLNSFKDQTTDSYNSISSTKPIKSVPKSLKNKDEQPKALPSSTPHLSDDHEAKENKGLFATIMSTVNNMLPINKKSKQHEYNSDNELDKILFSKNQDGHKIEQINDEGNNLHYCKKIGPNGDCPETEMENHESLTAHFHHTSPETILSPSLTLDSFLKTLASKFLEISELLAILIITAAASLVFIFGYYCFCNSSREGALLLKLNQMESNLLATHKENAILKHNLMSTRQKLASIEDNSFGSNDMVVSLKKELEEEIMEKARLQEQNTVLQKELENAADAGIELNKIVSELLSNQTGDESIISSVEELQKQLNEQQNTILEINTSLAEKSRENSELQLLIAEQNARYQTELANLQRDNDELEHEKSNLITKLDELKTDFDNDITAALEGKNFEIKRLQNEIVDLTHKVENEHTKWQTSVAKIEALEECLKNVRRDPHVNITEVIDVAYVKAQLIEIQNKYKSLKEKLETEMDSKKLTENQLEMVCAEVEKLKQDFNQSEKDKLEAQTRLEVLSNYFKDKENQLQKELSLKEAMWLQQQGETTTTVDRVTAMQEEIQSLKSQNDSLRAEIEAQVAAHKAQIGTLENRAHETWLAARQSDRRYEEARAEATALRRKLTALAGGNVNEVNNKSATGPTGLGDELPQAPSPIHMESPGSPMLGRMPPPPFLPPPFMGPPPPFMGMPPPPPFVPTGEMRPAPLGRIMSPPPQRSGRFSPHNLDYEDYLDYEGNNSWHRHTYSPPPRTYRSLSPTDSRYNYGTEHDLMSTYDTETDFSPPPSPRESRRRGGNSSERTDSKTKISYDNSTKFNTSKKGPLSSGSEKSFNTPLHNETKSKKGNASLGGKSLV